jgi:hypothetical protein
VNKAWYAAYASNLVKERRFRYYLEGGMLPETGRVHAGARDPSTPERDTPLWLPGTVYFATVSPFWDTGRALYDPDTPGRSAGRGYLITAEQFLDVVAQEMQLAPGTFTDTVIPAGPGERVRLGGGHYETLVCTGELDGFPVITMAAPWRIADVPAAGCAGPYREMIISGLAETFGWDRSTAESYLSALPQLHG